MEQYPIFPFKNMKYSLQLRIIDILKKSQLFLVIIFLGLSIRAGEASSTESQDESFEQVDTQTETPIELKVGLTYYFDTREYNTLNILTSVSDLPADLKIWGFIDIHGDQNSGDRRFQLTRYFLEYRLSRSIFPKGDSVIKGLGFEAEYNDFDGPDNDVLRLGLTYKHSIPFLINSKSWLQWRYHPYETDNTGSQVSVIYSLFLTERIYISGFADLNLEDNKEDRWVVEPQINFIVNESLDVVIEARYNEFEKSNPALDGFGIASGLKIKF